ncbi:MAG TPA: ABC transporter permease [Clostridiales bacterium]|jgi:spermidine/putrescine transport system permease protein|nr:ABC transporter permease [Clostridiales bacterium]
MNSKSRYLAYPYSIWMLVFILFPLFLIFLYSITLRNPNDIKTITFTFENFGKFFDPIYVNVLIRSISIAALSTGICLIVGYPVAYLLTRAKDKHKGLMILLFILPMWMNMLLRTYAWMTILGNTGLINSFLNLLNLPNVNLLYNNKAVILGMVYNFLPFMVFPIYTALNKMDRSLIEAADDLGADGFTIFKRVIFPLSLPGVISGIVMVFMPAVSTFVIPRLLGGGKNVLIGNLIEKLFLVTRDWNFGAALSMIILIIIFISIKILNILKIDKESGVSI